MATRSRVEVEALSQTRGQDEIEKGTVGEGIFSRFSKKCLIHLNVKIHVAVRYKFRCLLKSRRLVLLASVISRSTLFFQTFINFLYRIYKFLNQL
jgi:hypothetical protein